MEAPLTIATHKLPTRDTTPLNPQKIQTISTRAYLVVSYHSNRNTQHNHYNPNFCFDSKAGVKYLALCGDRGRHSTRWLKCWFSM